MCSVCLPLKAIGTALWLYLIACDMAMAVHIVASPAVVRMDYNLCDFSVVGRPHRLHWKGNWQD